MYAVFFCEKFLDFEESLSAGDSFRFRLILLARLCVSEL